jgi:type III pantothenate kinase
MESALLLAIEQGNTNTLFAIHDGADWIAQWRVATEASRTADEYAAWLYQLMAMRGLDFVAIDDCIISSVVPQSLFNLRKLSQRYFHKTPYVIGENAHLGIAVRIDKPKEAGADRLVNAVGGHIAYEGPLLIIDSGTATTCRYRPCMRRRPNCRALRSSGPRTTSARKQSARCSRASSGAISV